MYIRTIFKPLFCFHYPSNPTIEKLNKNSTHGEPINETSKLEDNLNGTEISMQNALKLCDLDREQFVKNAKEVNI